ncbi:DUF6603 domain-containing protein [Streptomyces sp. NPDC023327]|uniref:DUF6603 domain-containing protein n=1 Tax=Streptomyces sp. NPDC023327 TaxID=3157088 RepID=UPI0033DDDC98
MTTLEEPSGATTSATGAGTATTDANSTGWKALEQRVGPLYIRRLGVGMSDRKVWFLMDADLVFGGLSLAADGLGFGVSPDVLQGGDPQLEGALSGLAVAYTSPSLTVAGAIKKKPPDDKFDVNLSGGIIARTPKFSLEVLGNYQHARFGWFTLDVLGILGAPIGEPPVFVVTQLAGGFGYNSRLRVPTLAQVGEFPLLKALTDSNGGTETGTGGATGKGAATKAGAGDAAGQLLKLLGELRGDAGGTGWVTPAPGSFWAAAGLTFTACEMISGEAVLAVGFSGDVSITLAGHANASFPSLKDVPPQAALPRYSVVDVDVLVNYRTSTGLFAAEAALTARSFLLHPDCHLTGGLALYVWASGAHSGDFVLTVGGYPDHYPVPAHYPRVERVGVTWSPSADVAISGTAYCALTPQAVMAGGALDVSYHSGGLKAWLHASVHAIVAWAPFHFDVNVSVSVGVQYTFSTLGWQHTISAHVTVGLDVWGPPTGGLAHVDLTAVSFSVPFGQERPSKPAALDWKQVRAKLLPAQALCLSPLEGLKPSGDAMGVLEPTGDTAKAGKPSSGAKKRPDWHASASGFSFSVRCAVPATTMTFCEQPVELGAPPPLGVRPMRREQLVCLHDLSIRYQPATGGKERILNADELAGWTRTPVFGEVPAAIWGPPLEGDGQQMPDPDAGVLRGRVLGMTVTAHAPQLNGAITVPGKFLVSENKKAAGLPLRAKR